MGFLDWLVSIDTSVLLAINGYHTAFLDHFMMLISGKLIWAFFYVTLLFAAWRSFGWRGAVIVLVSAGLLILLCDQVCAHVIRPWVARMRPSNVHNPIEPMVQLVNGYRAGGGYTFPSCHASNTFGLAVLIALFFKKHWISVTMVTWSVVVCFSRVYLGVHYPLDILCGMAIGAMFAYMVYRLATHYFVMEPNGKEVKYIPAAGVGATLLTMLFI